MPNIRVANTTVLPFVEPFAPISTGSRAKTLLSFLTQGLAASPAPALGLLLVGEVGAGAFKRARAPAPGPVPARRVRGKVELSGPARALTVRARPARLVGVVVAVVYVTRVSILELTVSTVVARVTGALARALARRWSGLREHRSSMAAAVRVPGADRPRHRRAPVKVSCLRARTTPAVAVSKVSGCNWSDVVVGAVLGRFITLLAETVTRQTGWRVSLSPNPRTLR